MKTSQYLRLAIIAGVVIGGIFVFLPGTAALPVVGGMIAMLATVLVGQAPRPKAFILQNKRLVAIAGWSMAGLGIVLSLVMGWRADEARMAPGLMLSVVGVSLASLPRSLTASEVAKAQAQTTASRTKASGLQEGFSALASSFRDLRGSAAVLGPWFGLFLAAPTAAVVPLLIIGNEGIKGLSRGGAFALLMSVVAAVLVMYGALMAAAIQWVRFVAVGRPPPLTVPWRPLWSFAWRWIVFGTLSRVPNQFGPWLKAHYPVLPPWASVSLISLVGVGFLTLISPFGLVLPALALRAKDASISYALLGMRRFGRSFYAGALVVLAPFALLSWLIDLLPENSSNSVLTTGVGIALFAAWALSFFVTIPAAMTYLTRVRSVAADT